MQLMTKYGDVVGTAAAGLMLAGAAALGDVPTPLWIFWAGAGAIAIGAGTYHRRHGTNGSQIQ